MITIGVMIDCARFASASKSCNACTRQLILGHSNTIRNNIWKQSNNTSKRLSSHLRGSTVTGDPKHQSFIDIIYLISRVCIRRPGLHDNLIRRAFSTSSKACSNEAFAKDMNAIDEALISKSNDIKDLPGVIIRDRNDFLAFLRKARIQKISQAADSSYLDDIGNKMLDSLTTLTSSQNILFVKNMISENPTAVQHLILDILSLLKFKDFTNYKLLVGICNEIHLLGIQPNSFDISWGKYFLQRLKTAIESFSISSTHHDCIAQLSTILDIIQQPSQENITNPDDIVPDFLATYLSSNLSSIIRSNNPKLIFNQIDLLRSFVRLQILPGSILPGSTRLILTSFRAQIESTDNISPSQIIETSEILSAMNFSPNSSDANGLLRSLFMKSQNKIMKGEFSNPQLTSLLISISSLPSYGNRKSKLLEVMCQYLQDILKSSDLLKCRDLISTLYALSLNCSLSNVESIPKDSSVSVQSPSWLFHFVKQFVKTAETMAYVDFTANELGLMLVALGKIKFKPPQIWLREVFSNFDSRMLARTVNSEDLTTFMMGMQQLSVNPYLDLPKDFLNSLIATCTSFMSDNLFSVNQVNTILTYFRPAEAMDLKFLKKILSSYQYHLESEKLSISDLTEMMRLISSSRINPEISNPGFVESYIKACDEAYVKTTELSESNIDIESLLFAVSQLDSPSAQTMRIILNSSVHCMRAGLCNPSRLHRISSQLALVTVWPREEIVTWSKDFFQASASFLPKFNQDEFSGILTAFLKLEIRPDDAWIKSFFAASQQVMEAGGFNKTASYAAIMRVLQRQRIHPDFFFDEKSTTTSTWIETFLRQSQVTLSSASANDLYVLIDSLAALNIYPEVYTHNSQQSCQWLIEYMDRTKSLLMLNGFTSRELQHSIQALIALKIKPDAEWIKLFMGNCLQLLEQMEFMPGGLIRILHSLEKLKVPPDLYHEALRTAILVNCNRFIASGSWNSSNQGINKVISILTKLNIRPAVEVTRKYQAIIKLSATKQIDARKST